MTAQQGGQGQCHGITGRPRDGTNIEQPLWHRVIFSENKEAENHLRRQGGRKAFEMVDKQFGPLQKADKHCLVLEVLVWNVKSRRFLIQVDAAEPTVPLEGFAIFLVLSQHNQPHYNHFGTVKYRDCSR